MSTFQKQYEKFCRKPIPNDITFDEVTSIAKHFGCIVETGHRHIHIVYPPLQMSIPIPVHGKVVKEAYIDQLKQLFNAIQEEK